MRRTEEMKQERSDRIAMKRAEVMDRVRGKNCSKCWCSLEDDRFHAQAWWLKCHSCFREMMNLAARKKKTSTKDDPLEYIRNKFAMYWATARQRWFEFNLSLQDLVDVYSIQSGKCLFTGVVLQTTNPSSYVDYLTLDRLDNNYWYVKGNIAFVSREFNQMIKKNISIDFIREWIPRMYQIIEDFRTTTWWED